MIAIRGVTFWVKTKKKNYLCTGVITRICHQDRSLRCELLWAPMRMWILQHSSNLTLDREVGICTTKEWLRIPMSVSLQGSEGAHTYVLFGISFTSRVVRITTSFLIALMPTRKFSDEWIKLTSSCSVHFMKETFKSTTTNGNGDVYVWKVLCGLCRVVAMS